MMAGAATTRGLASNSPVSRSFAAARATAIRTRARAIEFSRPRASSVAISRIRRIASIVPSPAKS